MWNGTARSSMRRSFAAAHLPNDRLYDRNRAWLTGHRPDRRRCSTTRGDHHWLLTRPAASGTLIVNPKVAQWLAVDFFHLLGYRQRHSQHGKIVVSRLPRHTGSP